MKKIQSVASRTDIAVLGPTAKIEERDGYWVVFCPDNPGFIWGNYLLWPNPPREGESEHWIRLYDDYFKNKEGIINQTFLLDTLDGSAGASDEFTKAGFAQEKTAVLTCEELVKPAKLNDKIEVRPIVGDKEYEAAVDMQVRSRDECFSEDTYRSFRVARMAAYRALVDEGKGQWYGAFIDGNLVGDLGVFIIDGLARYQFVTTCPNYRRQGVCTTLMYETALMTLACNEVDTLVIASDPEYHSTIVYESVGFGRIGWQIGWTRRYER